MTLVKLIKENSKKTIKIGFLLTALVLSGVNVADASDKQSFEKLARIKLALTLNGYSCGSKVSGQYQQQGQTYNVYTTLNKNTNYILVAAGNVWVKDLDIVLHDENHNVIARDNSADSIPMVRVTPRWTGRFHAKVKMYRGKGYSNLMVCYQR